MITAIISRLVILVFGTLYPAYASYKTVKSKNLRDYVKWMMYWIVFAIFTCLETITDIFLSWFPFYYEIKIVIVIWLLSPATKGATFLYRKFVHPILSEREQEIDDYIAKAKEQSYKQVIDISSKGMNALMQTALKNLIPVSLLRNSSNALNPLLTNNSSSDKVDGEFRESLRIKEDAAITDDDGETSEAHSEDEKMLDDWRETTPPRLEEKKKTKKKNIRKEKAVPKVSQRVSRRKVAKQKTDYCDFSDDN